MPVGKPRTIIADRSTDIAPITTGGAAVERNEFFIEADENCGFQAVIFIKVEESTTPPSKLDDSNADYRLIPGQTLSIPAAPDAYDLRNWFYVSPVKLRVRDYISV